MAELSVSDWNFHKALNFFLGKDHTCDFTLKVKQLEVIKAIVQQNRHVLAALPTGYDKSLTGCVDTMASYERPAIIFKNKRPELPVIASVVNRAEVKNSDKLSFEGMPDYLADVKAGLAEIVFAHPDSRGLSLLAAENADL